MRFMVKELSCLNRWVSILDVFQCEVQERYKHSSEGHLFRRECPAVSTICSAMICHQAVFEFHFNTSQGTVLGRAPFHALAPHPK